MFKSAHMKKKIFITLLLLLLLGYLSLVVATAPSNDRNWALDQSRLATAHFESQKVYIRNIRNFKYRSVSDYSTDWYDRSFDMDSLIGVYFIVEPFSDWDGAAHTFLSFEFEDGQFLSISVEIRKEHGETFSPLKGLFRQYEIMYVIADERDVVKLRTSHRKSTVHIYPAKMPSHQAMKNLFTGMLKRANQLRDIPEYYNTLINTCTTNIVNHINTQFPDYVPWSHKILFPGYSDQLAYELGMIDTNLALEDIRDYYRINELALQYADNDDFSIRIRKPRL